MPPDLQPVKHIHRTMEETSTSASCQSSDQLLVSDSPAALCLSAVAVLQLHGAWTHHRSCIRPHRPERCPARGVHSPAVSVCQPRCCSTSIRRQHGAAARPVCGLLQPECWWCIQVSSYIRGQEEPPSDGAQRRRTPPSGGQQTCSCWDMWHLVGQVRRKNSGLLF